MTSLYIFYMKSNWCFLFTVIHSEKALVDFPGGPVVRIHLPVRGAWVRPLIRENSTCRGATEFMRHSYRTCALEPTLLKGSHCDKPAATKAQLRNKQANKQTSWTTRRIWQKLLTISSEKGFTNTLFIQFSFTDWRYSRRILAIGPFKISIWLFLFLQMITLY